MEAETAAATGAGVVIYGDVVRFFYLHQSIILFRSASFDFAHCQRGTALVALIDPFPPAPYLSFKTISLVSTLPRHLRLLVRLTN